MRPPEETITNAVQVRRLKPEDLSAYRAVREAALTDSPMAFTSSAEEDRALPNSSFLHQIVPPDGRPDLVMGAFDRHGELVGVAGLRTAPQRQAAHKGTLFGMAVLASASGRGVGRMLVEAVLAQARAAGLRQVVLTYSESNAAAEALYRRCGFVQFGREPRAVIVGDVEITKVHMIRDLER
jgi:ribosomal protein S18 acetylase RimI-like enzyme